MTPQSNKRKTKYDLLTIALFIIALLPLYFFAKFIDTAFENEKRLNEQVLLLKKLENEYALGFPSDSSIERKAQEELSFQLRYQHNLLLSELQQQPLQNKLIHLALSLLIGVPIFVYLRAMRARYNSESINS